MTVATYLTQLQQAWALGDATEHTHRAALQALIEAAHPQIQATNEPKALARENKPDYVIRQNGVMVGFVEAKDIGIDLQATLKTPQLIRYREALPNLLLTNYLDFIWFVQGEKRLEISLGTVGRHALQAVAQNQTPAQVQWDDFIRSFLNEVTPVIDRPALLAQSLGGQTRLLRDLVAELVSCEDPDLSAQCRTFQTLLLPDLSIPEFADMYAQTAAYGLFTARVFEHTTLFGQTSEQKAEALPSSYQNTAFSLEKSPYLIPKANPFLRQFFQHIASPDLNPQLRWLIEQIAHGLAYVDMDKVLHLQTRKLGFEDPIFHFYERFLAEYDSALREQRGVYYTPEPVVDFMVRGVDWLLKEELGKPEGLADKDTLVLDPAAGTATFLRKVIEHIHGQVTAQGNAGVWPQYVRERLLPRLFGFELMMAPYTVAHLKLALQLQETGFVFGQDKHGRDERLNVYLTNTLDTLQKQTDAFLSGWIAAENQGAEEVKRHRPVQVVLGNPPYSGESRNKSTWITQLMGEYKKEPEGGSLKERNSKWLNDDYVKFLRFAQDRIARTGHGVVAFITNHSWLDNPTFRGMRASLMRDFDTIHVLDLHGNSKKKEQTPVELEAQGPDKNVFDIEQGVSITFLLKKQREDTFELGADPHQGGISGPLAQIHHHELWGRREGKYGWLKNHSLVTTPWRVLEPAKPLLLFVPRDERDLAEYERGWKVTDIMPVNGTGIVTKCDELNIHFSSQACFQAMRWFTKATETEARARFRLPKPEVRDWKFDWAKRDVENSGLDQDLVQAIAYRPFDTRYTYYTGHSRGVMGWPVDRIMSHLIKVPGNVGLIAIRQSVVDEPFSHIGISDTLIDNRSFYSNKGIPSLFPLWLYQGDQSPVANLASDFLIALHTQGIPETTPPQDILAYLYAVLHAPSYRRRYAEYLKSDFPRIPIQTCPGATQPFVKLWQALQPLGHALIDLHLLKKVPVQDRARFPVAGTNEIEKPRFELPDPHKTPGKMGRGRVWLNATQYFDGVPAATWAFKVGGYQVCEKWLKDRKGRTLSLNDIEHYQQIVSAVTQTQRLMADIDQVVVGQLWPQGEEGFDAEKEVA